MIFTKKIMRAIELFATIHRKQYRKGTRIPYVIHPFEAFLIGSKYTDDENTLVAILLHDGPEDTDLTFEEITKEFGPDVSEIVRAVTKDKCKGLPYEEKETKYLEQLRNARAESVIVCASDKIHNMLTTIKEYPKDKENFWKKFHVKKEQKVRYYENVLSVLKERLSGGILKEYEETLSRMKIEVNT